MSKMASRRKHQRIGCSVPASIQLDASVFQANIVNFCEQGLLVNCSPETADGLTTNLDKAHYTVSLICHINDIQQQLDLKIRRTEGPYFGLYSPQGLPPLFFDALQHHSSVSMSDTRLDTPKQAIASSRQRLLLQDVLNCCHVHINQKMSKFFDQLPDILMQGAERAAATQVQALFDVSSRTRVNAKDMSFQFKASLQEQIEQCLQSPGLEFSRASGKERKLSLVEADVFDRWISVKAAAQRIENQVHQPLASVVSRLKPIFDSPEETPLLPRGQTKVLQDVLEQYQFDQKPLKMALDAFAQKLVQGYEDYLDNMNSLLEKHGYFQAKSRTMKKETVKATSDTGPIVQATAEHGLSKENSSYKAPTSNQKDISVRDRMLHVHQLIQELKDAREKNVQPSFDTVIDGQVETDSGHGVDTDTSVSTKESAVTGRAAGTGGKGIQTGSGVEESGVVLMEQSQVITILKELFTKTWERANILSPTRDQAHQQLKLSRHLLHQVQKVAQEQDAKLTASDSASLELVDAFFDDLIRNQFLIEDLRFLVNTLRAIFAVEFIEQGIEFYSRSSLRNIIFTLHSIAHEPMSWLGRHKKTILDAYRLYEPHGRQDLEEANLQMTKALETVKLHLESVRERNRTKLIETSRAKFEIALTRQQVQNYVQRFVSSEGLVPRWLEQLMRHGWCEHLCFLAIREGMEQGSYPQSTLAMQYLFDVVSQASHCKVELDPALKDIALAKVAFIREQIIDQQSDPEVLFTWSEKILDILNGHENDLCHSVPPSHWYEPKQAKETYSQETRYTQHKLANVEEGDWFYCPQFEREKTYLQVAWIAPDQSKFLLVNHSFVNSGEFNALDFIGLITTPGTRQVSDSQLPFQPKGIEQHFYQIYDRMRNGLLRDTTTGFLVRADFERYVQQLLVKESLFTVCVLGVSQSESIQAVYGSELFNTVLSHVASQITEHKNTWLLKHPSHQVLHMARVTDQELALCFQDKDASSAPDLQASFHNFCQFLNGALAPVKLHSNAISVQFYFTCMIATQNLRAKPQVIINTVVNHAKAVESSKKVDEGDASQKIQYVTLEQVNFASEQQAGAAWVLSTSLETMGERLQLQKYQYFSFQADKEGAEPGYERFEIAENDRENPVLDQFFKADRTILLDQWIVQEACKALEDEKLTNLIITLRSTEFQDNQFFEFLFEKMAAMPPQAKLHFCFDMFNLPSEDFLVDFSLEIKSYGSEMFLKNWGLAPQSFQVLQYEFIDSLIFDEKVVFSDNEKVGQLFKRLVSVLDDYPLQRILPDGGKKEGQFSPLSEARIAFKESRLTGFL